MASSTVLILGGGVGGVVAANRLRQRLGWEHRVLLVDREERHYFPPSFPWVMVGWRRPQSAYRDLSGLSRKGIEVVRGAVTELDMEGRKVHTEAGELSWDHLVVALGTEMAYGAVPGLAETAHTFYSLDGATRLRDALGLLSEGKVVVAVAGVPYRCPAAPYEGALLIDYYLRRRGVRDRVEVKLITPEPAPLPVAGPALGEAVKEMLRNRDIAFTFGTGIAQVDAEKREMVFEDDTRETFDLLVAIPQHRAPAVVRESGLAGETGWVEVDRSTLETAVPDVYAVGDVTSIPLASGLPLPKAGVFAHGQAEVVAANLVARIRKREARARFDGHGS
ncbi:MAG: NAD(P)/FAD-dependent oxidoreductase [Chloroflexi bacterium]|nr:NAD(P)/FAD-dependent oxidoreductase [Chloroflexota bacterium]